VRTHIEGSEGLQDELALLHNQLEKERSERISLERRHCDEVLSRLTPITNHPPPPITLKNLQEKFAKFQFVCILLKSV